MQQGIGRGDRGVSRPAAVMQALEQARVEILLLAEDFDAPELDEALEKAITQSAHVIVVRHYDDLELHGGIGAVLRF
jgi:stalled ribosome rescue protein Dom34